MYSKIEIKVIDLNYAYVYVYMNICVCVCVCVCVYMPINIKFEVQTCLKSVCLKTLLWYLVSVLFERKVR